MRLALLLGLLSAPVAAGAAPPPMLGKMINTGKNNILPQVGLQLDVPEGPQAGVVRQIALDWQSRPLQVGNYPAAAFSRRREGTVGLRLTIEPDGRLSTCDVTTPSGIADLDAHACKHLLTHTRYHPGLDGNGKRFGGVVAAKLDYQLSIGVNRPLEGGASLPETAVPAKPLETITLATLGITKATKLPSWAGGISAALLVKTDGSVGACTLTSPTYHDGIDAGACQALRERVRFRPARDRSDQPTADIYTLSLPFGY